MKIKFNPILLTIILTVSIEAIAVLFFFDQHLIENLAGDEIFYNQIASNLIEHQSFSYATGEPYFPITNRAPGYAFFLAVLYLFGKSFLFVYLVQFALLIGTSFALYRLARHFTGERESVFSAMICATYPPLVFLSAFHLSEILATLMTVIAVLFFVKAKRADNKLLHYFFVGVLLGALTLTRQSLSLVTGMFLLGIIIEKTSPDLKKRFLFAAVMLFGCLIVIAPWITRNILLTKQFIPFGVAGGESLYVSAKQYRGDLSCAMSLEEWEKYLAERAAREAEINKELDNPQSQLSQKINRDIPRQVNIEILLDDQFRREGKEIFRTLDITTILKNIPKRIAYLWSTYDTSPYASGGLFNRFVQLNYALIALLFLIGFVSSFKSLSAHYPLLLLPIYLTFFHLIFHIEPRYSTPARPFIFIYAGIGAIWLFDLIRRRKFSNSVIEPSVK